MAKHPASEHHRSAADKHRAAEEAHRQAHEAHERNDQEAATEHATKAHLHGQEAARHADQARDAYNPEGRASRTDLPPEASGLDQNPRQGGVKPGRPGRGEPPAVPASGDDEDA